MAEGTRNQVRVKSDSSRETFVSREIVRRIRAMACALLAVAPLASAIALGPGRQEAVKPPAATPAQTAPAATPPLPGTFVNPVVKGGADPWVVQQGGFYYYCKASRGKDIVVAKSAHLVDIGNVPQIRVWEAPTGTAWSKQVWAPELHYLRGKWYIYVAADDGHNENHRMYVLEGTSQDPQAPFVFKGELAAKTDRWAIDGTVLEMSDNRLYFIWSGWDGTSNIAQNLYIAPMSDPWTINGERACISRPELAWEKRGGKPAINEGPETLWHDGHLFVIYSASGSWSNYYCLGELTWTGHGDVMDPHSWVKESDPVFSGTPTAISPGHCSFVKSRDGKQDWIVFHTAKHAGAAWDRQVETQPFRWNADGSPNFGTPVAAGEPLPLPSGD